MPPDSPLHLRHYASGPELLADAGAFLDAHEAEHNLLLGLCASLTPSAIDPSRPPLLVRVADGAGTALVAAQTPPHNLVLSRAARLDAIGPLADDLHARGASLPAVLGPPPVAAAFAERWSRAAGVAARVAMEQRIYALTEVTPPRRCPGTLRAAAPEDVDLLASWAEAFADDARLPSREREQTRERVGRLVTAGSLFVWDDGGPASMAGVVRRTPRGAGVSLVYTPPARRGRGYASSCVAALSQRLLDGGRAFCFLYTDLANPTSNAIYTAIGYRAVADSTLWSFEASPSS